MAGNGGRAWPRAGVSWSPGSVAMAAMTNESRAVEGKKGVVAGALRHTGPQTFPSAPAAACSRVALAWRGNGGRVAVVRVDE